MFESEMSCGEEHPIDLRLGEEPLIPTMVSVPMVSDDWVSEVIEMATDLVPAPGQWFKFEKGEATDCEVL